jgi:protein-disulfide isomerase
MKKKDNPIPIILSVIALALAAYATFNVVEIKNGGASDVSNDSEAFKANVFEVIDDYIAEKSGQPTGPVEVSVDDDAVKGDKNAPVTIVEFSDYECPFCGKYFEETLPQITENYIDTGKVKYVFRDFPLNFHAKAKPAANAAECVREQGGDEMYFEYHDVLFNNQDALDVDSLKKHAADFDIDQTEFASCVDENKYSEEIDKDFADGSKYGVRGTPAFFINGVPVSGAQPYENFKAVIEQALSN